MLPTDAQFQAHGLLEVEIDPTSPTASPMIIVHASALQSRRAPSADWVSGWARIEPTAEYPLLDDIIPNQFVRWHFCPHDDTISALYFRRQAQVKALDTVPYSLRTVASSPSSPSSPAIPEQKGFPRRFRPPARILAWWEDSLGFWFVIDGQPTPCIPFPTVWADTLGEDWPCACATDADDKPVRKPWAAAIDLLLQAVECLQALHDRRMSLNWCHPSCFMVLNDKVVVNRLWDATALPGLSLNSLLTPALASSALFARDPIHHSSSTLSENYVFRHLRYLAPEAAISQRVSPSNDIYGWGVFAYELVTGTTIDGGPDSPDLADIDLLADVHRHVTTTVTPPMEYLTQYAEENNVELDLPPQQLSEIIMLALAKDPEERYHCLDALAYDLSKLSQVCKAQGDLSKITVGEVDRMSRFKLPRQVIERGPEIETLDTAFNAVASATTSSRVINVWGQSGNGKSRLVNEWINQVEVSNCLVGNVSLSEHVKKPLASFVDLFQSLLDRVLTDPREDSRTWLEDMRETLGTQWTLFASLLSNDCRRLINVDEVHHPVIESEKFLVTFRNWAKRFLQLFATKQRPLLIVVDDTQWMSADEIDIWRHMLDGSQPLDHVLVIYLTRTNSTEPPPVSWTLSRTSVGLHVRRLTEDGVAAFINSCFSGRVANSEEAIASFLYGETGGSPLFLKSLMNTLLKDYVVAFDYDALQWRFDLVALQSHLSDASFDAYLESVMRRLPTDVHDMLKVLGFLPANGFPLEALAGALGKGLGETDNLVQVAIASGAVSIRGTQVRFTHDRQRLAARSLVPEADVGTMHLRIFSYLCRDEFLDEYIFDAVEQGIIARDMGIAVTEDSRLVSLLIDATQCASLVANFTLAKNFATSVQSIIDASGGFETWIVDHRDLCFNHVRLLTDVANVFHEHDLAFKVLESMKPLCRTSTEKITISTTHIRQLISDNQHVTAIEHLFQTLDEFGFNPEAPTAVPLWAPKSPQDVEAFRREMIFDDPFTGDEDGVLIMSLISYAGPSIYVTNPERRQAVFQVGLSIAKHVKRVHESASYLITVHALTIDDPPTQYALIKLGGDVCDRYPTSLFTNSSRIAIAAQAHLFSPLKDVVEPMTRAFDASLALADYQIAAYVVALDLTTRIFGPMPVEWGIVARRYDMIKPYATATHHVWFHLLVQHAENLSRASKVRPWDMEGPFFIPHDLDGIEGLHLHKAIYDMLRLRLQLLFDAPEAEIKATLAAGRSSLQFSLGLAIGTEFQFILAMAQLRVEEDTDLLDAVRKSISPYAEFSPDLRARLDVLSALEDLKGQGATFETLHMVDEMTTSLDEGGQYMLSGFVNFCFAKALEERSGSAKLAAGYIRAAFNSYRAGDADGLCLMLRARYPAHCSTIAITPRGPADFFSPDAIPQLRRISVATTAETASSSIPRSEVIADGTSSPSLEPTINSINDNLDTLTLMRSAIALAQHKDSLALLGELLKILCQFTRCDYAAIGLSDDDDRSIIRLKAAGPFNRIVSYDLDISDDAAQSICPTTVMLHVARTGIPIRKPVKMSRLRNDPFYNNRQPRTLLCLPIINQGVQTGVILLMSMTSASPTVQYESAPEIVSTLATFAYIIHLHHIFTSRLKTEVTQRTRELSSALQAKTQFLSQCSHELRSPLAAIMGLAAVLEASQGLTAVQREHLQTIMNSGQDLLALISNILDHSKLESNSVLLEHIPFNVRNVVEGALDMVAPVAQSKNVELTVLSMFKNDPPGLLGDPFRVKQVLLNLLSNAVKFTPPGEKGKRTARVTVKRTWEEVENQIMISITVEDNGVGIPASRLSKLFKSFSQVDESITRSYGGSGLGLVISRDLARLLGGDCVVESEFGKGSKFTFTFVATRDPDWAPTPLRKFTITQSVFIFVQADMVWGKVLEEDLKEFNCAPTRFTEDKLALKEGHPGGLNSGQRYAFILLDASMIDRDTLTRMRQLQPNAKFMFVSRATEISLEMDRLQIPRDSILARPLKFQALNELFLPTPVPRLNNRISSRKAIDPNLGKEKPLHVLVVDDSTVNISVCTRILELFGYTSVDSALDGMQATECAERKRYDLILLDLQMPVLDGFGALKRIQASPLAGEPCCVSLSANVDKATQTRCLEAGFFGVLCKPVDIPKLGQVLVDVYHYRMKRKAELANPFRQLPARATTLAPIALQPPPQPTARRRDTSPSKGMTSSQAT